MAQSHRLIVSDIDRRARRRAPTHASWKALDAVVPAHFFDQINLAIKIESIARNLPPVLFSAFQTDSLENQLGLGDFRSENVSASFGPEQNLALVVGFLTSH